MGPSWAPLEPSWGHLRPSWGHLGPSWSLKGARTRNPENHRKTIGFSTFLASRVPSGSVLGVSGTVLGASCGIREASGAIVARLGGVLQACWKGLGSFLGGLGPRKVTNMAPTCFPKWSQNDQQIHPKTDHFFDAFWNRFLSGFWWILGARMTSKIDINFEGRKPTKR